jgi:hypothetical protein
MTGLLYYSILSNLTEEEITDIDHQVCKNRREVYFFIKNFPTNQGGRTKKIIFAIFLISGVWFSNLEPANSINLSMPFPSVVGVRVKPNFESSFRRPEKSIPREFDYISYKYFSKPQKELLLIYATDSRLRSNQQILKLVKDLRGGNWNLIGTAAFLAIMILIFSIGESFVPNIGWGLERIDPFQLERIDPFQPTMHKFPPYYDLFSANGPGGSHIMSMSTGDSQSSREKLTQLSTEIVPTKTQVSEFVKNGKVNLNQAFNEVNRRASKIGSETFDCSFIRFKELATECGEIRESGIREAITILQGEMQGYYKNARRVDFGENVKSLDFAVDGIGEFVNITHAEAKNAVGSAIEIADGFDTNIWKQGKRIGKKSVWQKKFWSDTSRTSEVANLNYDAYLPKSVNNTLTVVDCFDVMPFEKATMNSAIIFGSKNDTNLIILNNHTNI